MAGVRLFVYGTLMSEAQLHALTGRYFPRRPATLDGFARIAPQHGYPYVVPRPGSRVEGILLDGIDPASLRTLDRYEDEGRLYVRTPVDATVDGTRIACDVYVGNPALGDRER